MNGGFWNAVGGLWYALRHCDAHDHVECDHGHEADPMTEERFCATCGGELRARVGRPLMVRLSLQQMRTAIFPYRLYSFEPDSPTCDLSWNWRARRLHSRRVPNSLRWPDAPESSS